MTVVGYLLIGLFVALCVIAAGGFIWTVASGIRMTSQFKEPDARYSRSTLWNPMNAMFSPHLLNEAGLRSRRSALRGLMVFFAAYACAGCFALVMKLLS
jgi:hypothetical protein